MQSLKFLILLIVAGIGLLLLISSFTLKGRSSKLENFNDGPISRRFKRDLSVLKRDDCPSNKTKDLTNFDGLKILERLSESKYRSNLVKNRYPTLQNPGVFHRSAINPANKYLHFAWNNPVVFFSLNVPSIECLANSSFFPFFKRYQRFVNISKRQGYNALKITDIPKEEATFFVQFLKNLSAFLLELDPDFASESQFFTYNKSQCKFVSKCIVTLQYKPDLKYFATFQFSSLPAKSQKLSAVPTGVYYDSRNSLFVNMKYTDIKEQMYSDMEMFNANVTESFKKNMQTNDDFMNNAIRQQTEHLMENSAYSLIKKITNEKSTELSQLKSASKSIDTTKLDDSNFYQVDSLSDKNMIEFSTFTVITTEFQSTLNELPRREISKFDTALSVTKDKKTSILSKSILQRNNVIFESFLPSLTTSSTDFVNQHVIGKNEELEKELKSREDLINGLNEMYTFAIRMNNVEKTPKKTTEQPNPTPKNSVNWNEIFEDSPWLGT